MDVFRALVGQDEAVATLRAAAAAAAGRVAGEPAGPAMTHAWLFTGPAGSGRSVAARAFAAALQCADQGCGTCPACHTTLAGFVATGACATNTASCTRCHFCPTMQQRHQQVAGFQCKDRKCYECHQFTPAAALRPGTTR